MADEPRRIIELPETQLVGSGDYLALDSADGGTKKVKASYFSGSSENYMWGGIQGDIADQTDLYEYLEQLPEKANIDGYYEDMSVGSAEQLLSNMFEDDSTPYLYRTSGGSLEIGDRVYEDAIVGGSVAWNQLLKLTTYEGTSKGITCSSLVTGGKSFEGTAEEDYTLTLDNKVVKFTANHIYLLMCVKGGSSSTYYYQPSGSSSAGYGGIYSNDTMMKPTASSSEHMRLIIKSGTTVNFNARPQIFDLTLALGSTIADYAYTLETSEAGSGIAWLKSQGFFTKDYYAYNAGGIESVKTSAKKVVGFNAYDNATGKAHLVGGHEYQITGAYTALAYSTGETITPDANGKFTPSADGELTVTGGDGTTTCVHLVWDGEKDGEYEPYEENTYPLDADLELRGIPKLVDGKIKYDGDTYASDGSVTRKYGIVDMGTLTWAMDSTSSYNYFSARIDGCINSPAVNSNKLPISAIYVGIKPSYVTNLTNMTIMYRIDGTGVYLRSDDYDDATTFKTAMNGKYLVYELATPTTETADPYTNPQLVDNWGTEQFIDERDVPVPVGHDSRYLPDLKAKLESAPNNPSTNGKYFLQYQNGETTYVPVPSEVPEAPSEDGTYVLKATVSGGTATLSWVAEE